MSLARLALQVGLIFCIVGAAVGLGAELSADTIIWRSLLCAVAGAALGAGIGALLRWLHGLSQDGTLDESGAPLEGLAADALATETATSAAHAAMKGEDHGNGG